MGEVRWERVLGGHGFSGSPQKQPPKIPPRGPCWWSSNCYSLRGFRSMMQKRGGCNGPHRRAVGEARPRRATPRPRSGSCPGAGGPRGAPPRSRSGGAAVRRYPSSKVRSSREEIPHVRGKRNPSKTVGVARGHQRADTRKPYHRKLASMITGPQSGLTQ